VYFYQKESGEVLSNFLVVSTSQLLVDQIAAHLIATYKRITFHQVAESYLGMTITRLKDLKETTITQQGLTAKIINSYLTSNSPSSRTLANTDIFGYDTSSSPS
jgi:hypothetical protein